MVGGSSVYWACGDKVIRHWIGMTRCFSFGSFPSLAGIDVLCAFVDFRIALTFKMMGMVPWLCIDMLTSN